MIRSIRRVAVVGGGIGGAAVAALLQQAGYDARVYEQAASFMPVGAGIHLSPNLVKVLDRIGAGDAVRVKGCRPGAFTNRDAATGEILFDLPLGDASLQAFNGPFLTLTRGDLLGAILDRVDPDSIEYGRRLSGLTRHGEQVRLQFADGSEAQADLVIGADGLRSKTREFLAGFEAPRYSGQVAFRGSYPTALLDGERMEDLTKWWAASTFALTYYLDAARDVFYFAAMTPQASWPIDASFVPGDKSEMLEIFAGFHPAVQQALRTAPPECIKKWALFERPATFVWGDPRVVLLGDACHPMRPFMSQGAAMALEDAAVLVRCLSASRSCEAAFDAYVATRSERLRHVHEVSSQNTFMRAPCNPTWVFAYDPTRMPIQTGPIVTS